MGQLGEDFIHRRYRETLFGTISFFIELDQFTQSEFFSSCTMKCFLLFFVANRPSIILGRLATKFWKIKKEPGLHSLWIQKYLAAIDKNTYYLSQVWNPENRKWNAKLLIIWKMYLQADLRVYSWMQWGQCRTLECTHLGSIPACVVSMQGTLRAPICCGHIYTGCLLESCKYMNMRCCLCTCA